MNKSGIAILGIMFCISAVAEMHVWTFSNGKSLEAEFVAFSGDQIALKSVKGKVKKIPVSEFSAEDLQYLELINPPRLELEVGKSSDQRRYPPTHNNNNLPRQNIFTFFTRIKQASNKVYSHGLTVEVFIIGDEKNGDKNLLFSYQKENFNLEGSGSSFEMKSTEIKITEYDLNGQRRGNGYQGYMILVTDSRGEIIASKASRDEWLLIVENLRKLPVGKTFDETGERAWPSRPKRFY